MNRNSNHQSLASRGPVLLLKEALNKKHTDNTSANKDAVNDLVDVLDDLVDENGVVEVEKYISHDDFVKAQKLEAEKIGPPIEEDKDEKVLKPWKEDLKRPSKCIDKIYCNYYLEQFLITFGLDDKRLGCTLNYGCSTCGILNNRVMIGQWDVEQVFIPINEPKRHCSLAQFHIQSVNVTFYDSQKTYDVEYRSWLSHGIPLDVEDPIGSPWRILKKNLRNKTALLAVSSNVLAVSSNVVAVSSNVLALAAVVISLSTLSPPPYRQPHLLQGLELEMGVVAQCELQFEVHEKLVEVFQLEVVLFEVQKHLVVK
ncbi:phospholipase-like protein [Tanacetum coccineum]|uniref:Phospholipase-like protein n=1 Tax=Tanacetum coccineum TaxID=301880 RepID=A0ABQ5EZC7_9ASTR